MRISLTWQTRTHCYRHKCFPVCLRAQHLLRTQILCPIRATKNVSDSVQKHFVSSTNVSQFAQHGNTTFILCPVRLRAQETLPVPLGMRRMDNCLLSVPYFLEAVKQDGGLMLIFTFIGGCSLLT